MNSGLNDAAGVFSDSEVKFIREAVDFLENPSLLMKIAAVVGKPAEFLLKGAPTEVTKYTENALRTCMDWAAGTVANTDGKQGFDAALDASWWSAFYAKFAAGVAGAGGGFFGLPGLAVELPLTTGIMLRSIASIGAEFGADLSDPVVRLQCLAIFSYGGPSAGDDAMESSFFTMKAAMAKLIKDAAKFVAGKAPAAIAAAMADGAAGVLAKLIAQIAAKFEIAVTEKFVAQSLPVIGAVSGAAINASFAGYFNSVARYQFGIWKLEQRLGEEAVESLYKAELALLRGKTNPANLRPSTPEIAESAGVLLRD